MGATKLDKAFATYADAAAALLELDPGNRLYESALAEADDAWLAYVGEGGGREPYHEPKDPSWKYQDGFEPMRLNAKGGPLKDLRRVLRIPSPSGDAALYFREADAKAVDRWRQAHSVFSASESRRRARTSAAATTVVDRHLWSLILESEGELAPSAGRLEQLCVPTNTGGPVVVRLRKPSTWMLALDDVPYRTFANHYNLGILATLAYSGVSAKDRAEAELLKLSEAPVLREDVRLRTLGEGDDAGTDEDLGGGASRKALKDMAWRPVVRRGDAYRYLSLEDPSTDTQGFVAGNAHHVIVAFRGTAGGQDILQDLDAVDVRWHQGPAISAPGHLHPVRVHQGFFEAFLSIREQLVAAMRAVYAPGRPIFLAGHSLGGALAVLAACYLRDHPVYGRSPLQLYTYGQPRVGTAAFAEKFWLQDNWARAPFSYYRTYHVFDTIPMVPSAYTADDVMRGIDPLLDAVASANPALMWDAVLGHPGVRRVLEGQAPPGVDYRHFGVEVACATNSLDHPVVLESSPTERRIEIAEVPAAHSIWGSRPWKHMMASYMTQILHEFEEQSGDLVRKGKGARLAFAGRDEPPLERYLTHRYIHSQSDTTFPAHHSTEELREAFR